MYHSIDEFLEDWAYESESTLSMLQRLTDESLTQCAAPECRTLRVLAWHIVQSPAQMLRQAGMTIETTEGSAPAQAADIAAAYEATARAVAEAVPAHWTDANLTERVKMYGDEWKKGGVLSSVIIHQVHHRGQMTMLMRMAGLTVPGVYGPAREEWAAIGMATQE